MHAPSLFCPSALALVLAAAAPAAGRPALSAFPSTTAVDAPGSYAATAAGEDFVLSGAIEGDVSVAGPGLFRVTLSNAVLSGTLSLAGDAQLWLVGSNSIAASAPSAVSASGSLVVGGPGALAASAPGGRKTGVFAVGGDFALAGGETSLTIASPAAKNACGLSLGGDYTQLAGSLSVVGESGDVRQNGVFLAKKKTSATISGGTLSVSLGGAKSVGLALAKDTCSAVLSGGVLRFDLSGDGAKGIKGDGADSLLSVTGGTLDLAATGPAGRLINAAGRLVIGVPGAATLPSDASFSPDIRGAATGGHVFRCAVPQKAYGSLATAVATPNAAFVASLPDAASSVVAPSASPGDDEPDYANPKGLQGGTSVAVHSGRLRVTAPGDGGEGLESKGDLSVTGGLLEFVCADDAINAAGTLAVDGGWIYAASSANDGIDSNGDIVVNGGVVLAFAGAFPECGIDADSPTGIRVNGGTVVSFGSATQKAYGSSGAQPSYLSTSVPAAAYAGQYLVLAPGSATAFVKVPPLSPASGTLSLMCSNDGWTTASAPSVSAAPPASGDTGFHGVHIVP